MVTTACKNPKNLTLIYRPFLLKNETVFERSPPGVYVWKKIQQGDTYYAKPNYTPIIRIKAQPPGDCNSSLVGKNDATTKAQLPCFNVFVYKGLTGGVSQTWGTYGYIFSDVSRTNIYSSNETPHPKP
jgi:hypothetical protein